MMTIRPPAIARTALALSAALLMLVGSGPAQGEAAKTTLRWKFKEGDVLRYSIDQSTVSTGQDPEGREVKQTFGLILDMTWTVKAVDASGVASVAQKIDRVRTSAVAPFGKFSFDSQDAGNAPGAAGPMFKLLLGAEFSSKFTPRGEVTDVKLSEKTLADLKSEVEAGAPPGAFSEVGLKNVIAQMFLPLAEGGVEVGETWKRPTEIPAGPNGQTRKIEQTFTYKGPNPAIAGLEIVEFATKLDPPKPDPNVSITLKKEAQTGRIEFDAGSGRVVRSNVEEDVEFSVAIQGKDVPQKATTTRILTLSKDKAP